MPFVEVMLRKRVPSEMRQMWTEPDALDAAVVPSGDTSMPSTRMPSLIARMGVGGFVVLGTRPDLGHPIAPRG